MGNLKNLFIKVIEEYGDVYENAKKSQSYKTDLGDIVRHKIVAEINHVVDSKIYKVKGSVGAGKLTIVPWVAVLDKDITTSVQKGVYIVYLINKDSKKLYLTLNQGATSEAQGGKEDIAFTGIASSKDKKTTAILREKALGIRKGIDINHVEFSTGPINTGSPAYDAGCIYSKEYSYDNMPEDEILLKDLKDMLFLYGKYKSLVFDNADKIEEPESDEPKDIEVADMHSFEQIDNYIRSAGFYYDDNLIKNFYLSLKTKPFVILAGISGTGKSKLVNLFAEAIGAGYHLIPVRPDWSDSSDLFGHTDLNGKFVKGEICEAFEEAQNNPNKPVFVCLDEMNLARVEYYFSDFLSVIESREKDAKGNIKTSKIKQYPGIPDNLYIVGTVNMDETTFPFSKKVLDRANTIEFNEVNLIPTFTDINKKVEPLKQTNDFLRSKYLILEKDCAEASEYVKKICEELQKVNEILKKANLHVGYRVRDEIVFYMLNNKDAGNLLSDEEAFDYALMQKILPRIQGSSESIKKVLIGLHNYCRKDGQKIDETGDKISEKMEQITDFKYQKSANKIAFMMKRYEDDGFTSFWL